MITAQKFTVNGSDQGYVAKSFVLWFGACSPTKLLAYGYLEDALEACGEWIEDNAPGLLCNEEVQEAFDDAKAAGKTNEEAWDESQTDVTLLDCGRHLNSHEWGIVAEDPSRAELAEIFGTDNGRY